MSCAFLTATERLHLQDPWDMRIPCPSVHPQSKIKSTQLRLTGRVWLTAKTPVQSNEHRWHMRVTGLGRLFRARRPNALAHHLMEH